MSARFSAIIVALTLAFVAVASAVVFYDWSLRSARLVESQAIKARIADLTDRSLAQNSPLACLAGDLGEAVETACERVVFSSPDTAAAAVAYTAARISLLADGSDYARRADAAFADTLNGLRRAIELDRFGLAAQVLATRDGCTSDQCAFFALTRDPSALKANIKAHAYETYVARYAPGWNAEERAPPVAEKPAEPTDAPQASVPPPGPAPVSGKYSFPSSASIPAVSIMNAEPPLPAKQDPNKDPNKAATPSDPADKSGAAKLPLPAKRPQTEAAAPPTR